MWYLFILSGVSYLLVVCGFTFVVAVGLYFLADLIEENTKTSAKVIRTMIMICAVLYVLLIPLESFPVTLVVSGLSAQLCHYMLMQTFPAMEVKSVWFAGTLGLFFWNNFVAYQYFTDHYHPFNEIAAYFIMFVWVIPMALLVSLSANDFTLPTYADTVPLMRNRDDLPSQSPFAQKRKGYSLKTFLTYIKERYLPMIGLGSKKSFYSN